VAALLPFLLGISPLGVSGIFTMRLSKSQTMPPIPGDSAVFSPLTLTASRILRRVRPAVLASGLCTVFGLERRKPFRSRHGLFFVSPVSSLGNTLIEEGEYEPSMAAVLQKYLKPGDVFIDLGANEGYFSVIASGLVGKGGRVIAIEPQARLQMVIQANLELNGCSNVEVHHILLSAADGESTLTLTPLNTGASSMTPSLQRLRRIMPVERVPSRTLGSFLESIPITTCDFMKVDIEGAEWDVFMGAGEVLRRGIIRRFALDIHNGILAARGIRGRDLHEFVLSCGYALDDSLGPWVYERVR
jgi:FkbM family methyltransferase